MTVETLAAGQCEWPYCGDAGEQMAHIVHRGMGGSKVRNAPENAAWLCIRHHDVLDGRTALGTLRFELNEMLRKHLGYARSAFIVKEEHDGEGS
jgi:hypothetical protein